MDAKTNLLITTQAAECVEEILETIEDGAKAKPWVLIVEERMKKLITEYVSDKQRRKAHRK